MSTSLSDNGHNLVYLCKTLHCLDYDLIASSERFESTVIALLTTLLPGIQPTTASESLTILQQISKSPYRKIELPGETGDTTVNWTQVDWGKCLSLLQTMKDLLSS